MKLINTILRGKIPHYLGTIAFLLWIPFVFGPIINHFTGITNRTEEKQKKLEIERIDKLINERLEEIFPTSTGKGVTGKVVTNGSNK